MNSDDFHAELYQINGYEGVYSITKDGRVWSHERTVEKSRKGGKTFSCKIGGNWMQLHKSSSYMQVVLCHNGKRKMPMIHRLIAETFIPNPLRLTQVNHIDGNKLNNNIENLEWASPSENQKHAWKTGLQKNTQKRRKRGALLNRQYAHTFKRKRSLSNDDARIVIDMIKSGMRISEAANRFGVGEKVIRNLRDGLTYKELSR